MHLKLDLNQDAELRNYIKLLIEQQVKSIVREEFSKMIEDEIYKKINTLTQGMSNGQWSSRIQKSCDNFVSNQLYNNNVFTYGGFTNDVNEMIFKIISQKLDDRKFNELVNKTASEKLKKLIEK